MRHMTSPWLAILAATSSLALLIIAGSTTASPSRAAAATFAATAEPGSQASALLNPCTSQPFTTVMTGDGLASASAGASGYGSYWMISFTLKGGDASKGFVDYTTRAAVNHYPLAIVLDGKVLSAPVVQAALTTGGVIQGNFTQAEATNMALQMESGILSVPLSVVSVDRNAGNLNIVLEVANGLSASVDMLEQTRQVLEKRLQPFHVPILNIPNASVKVEGTNRLVIQISNFQDDPQTVIDLVQTVGLLEFVDFSRSDSCQANMPAAGQYILTDTQLKLHSLASQPTPSPLPPTQSPTLAATHSTAALISVPSVISAKLGISTILGLPNLQISGFQQIPSKGIS